MPVYTDNFLLLNNKNKKVLVINELSLDNINNRYIGSEPPHIIYADSENIIINCGGVYVYNMSSKSLIKTLDVLSFKDEMDPDTFYDCFATEDGKKIIFTLLSLILKGQVHIIVILLILINLVKSMKLIIKIP